MRSNQLREFVAAAGLIAILAAPASALAGEAGCQKVYASGETMATGPASFAGTAWTSLGDITIGDFGDRQVTEPHRYKSTAGLSRPDSGCHSPRRLSSLEPFR